MKMDYEEVPMNSEEFLHKLKEIGTLKAEKLNFDKYANNRDTMSSSNLNRNTLKLTPFDWVNTQDEKYLRISGILTPTSNSNTLKSTIISNEETK